MAKDKKKKKKSSKTAKKQKTEVSLDDTLKTVKKEKTESPKGATTKIAKMPETELSLGSALSTALGSARETQTDLQGLLHGVSEGSWYYREPKKEEIIGPQLSHEIKSEIADDYLKEDIPISERKTNKSRTAQKTQETVAVAPAKENIYKKLQTFLEVYVKGYNERYNRWEDSIGNILAILRKMRKFTKKNTEDLINSIRNQFAKIKLNLNQFKIKRDEIEKISEINIETMSGEFKKVLGLLELQVKEYQLKKLTDEYVFSL